MKYNQHIGHTDSIMSKASRVLGFVKCNLVRLFSMSFLYSVYRKDRNIHGGGVMLLVHKDISHMPITELENNSESIWVKVFANKTSQFVASWYRPPGSTSEEFQLFREQLDYIRRVKSYTQSTS